MNCGLRCQMYSQNILTVISLGLAEMYNVVSRLGVFLNFLSSSEELYAVQCKATERRDHD